MKRTLKHQVGIVVMAVADLGKLVSEEGIKGHQRRKAQRINEACAEFVTALHRIMPNYVPDIKEYEVD